MPIKLLIADDHPIFRSGIRSVLATKDHFELLGEASDGIQAYQQVIALRPNIAVLDLEMPILSGIDVCQKALSEKSQTRFIILTMHKEQHFFEQAMKAGAQGYLLKDNAGQELIEAIENIWADKTYISPQIQHYFTEYEQRASQPDWRSLLTPTERVVIKLIAQGMTSQEIAGQLFVSANTIENHRYNIGKKLQLEGGKNSLLKFAMQYKDAL